MRKFQKIGCNSYICALGNTALIPWWDEEAVNLQLECFLLSATNKNMASHF